MNIDGFTISYSFETLNYGRKSSNFISVNFKLPNPVNMNEIESVRLEASKKVTIWAIQDAVMRGDISEEEARDRLEVIKMNFEGLQSTIEKRNSK